MKVYICSTTWDDGNILIERYPCLKDFGFIVEDVTKTARRWAMDENGGYNVIEFERTVSLSYIFIESLEDLDKLRKAVDDPLIFDVWSDGTYSIEIYDGYRE